MNDWFYPWPATVHSHLNPHNDTLEVWSGESVYTIRGTGHDGGRGTPRLRIGGVSSSGSRGTFPTLKRKPILPAFVARNPRARSLYDTCRQLDDHLCRSRYRPGKLHHRGRVPAEGLTLGIDGPAPGLS